jgi:hypothetical protein
MSARIAYRADGQPVAIEGKSVRTSRQLAFDGLRLRALMRSSAGGRLASARRALACQREQMELRELLAQLELPGC